jgi:serine O-acetyltransferase
MDDSKYIEILVKSVEQLSDMNSLKDLFHQHEDGTPLPSGKILNEIIELARAIIFPGYYGENSVNSRTVQYSLGVKVERMFDLLVEQVEAGLSFNCKTCVQYNRVKAKEIASELIARLPEIRRVLATDVIAAYNGDPAAEDYGEIISCYPVIKALVNYRLAHELFLLGVPLIPRIISEMAHSETGIDIHPGATIGEYFTIDHGTGVVIGATCIIGNNVKLYQGVTLGALSVQKELMNKKRHPTIEDNVTIYSGATILGGETVIGKNCVIGGNTWITKSIPEGTTVTQNR